MEWLKLPVLSVLIVTQSVFAQPFEPGKSYYDEKHWTELVAGTMPVVISVPHGGSLFLPKVPVRKCDDAVTLTDIHTIELSREIVKAFQAEFGICPYLIICHLSRRNIDQNRDSVPGTCNDSLMRRAWHTFHRYIDTALALATQQFGSALYIDLHGHSHSKKRVELGYNLSGKELSCLQKHPQSRHLIEKSSLNNLLQKKRTQGDQMSQLESLLTGENAFGTLLAKRGIAAVPSKQDPAPDDTDSYFNGAYNINRYTSAHYPHVYGWQLELYYNGIRDPFSRPIFAKDFAGALITFIEKNTPIRLFGPTERF